MVCKLYLNKADKKNKVRMKGNVSSGYLFLPIFVKQSISSGNSSISS